MSYPMLALLTTWSLTIGSLTTWSQTNPTNTITLTETALVQRMQGESAPELATKAQSSGAQLSQSLLDESFAPVLFLQTQQTRSTEQPISAFMPVFSPTTTHVVGMSARTRFGLDYSLALSSDMRSLADGSLRDATRTGYLLEVGWDLWRDLWRGERKNQSLAADLSKDRAQLEERWRLHQNKIDARKIFWSLVINQEKMRLASEQLQTSEQQSREALRRLRNSIADEGEYARFEAARAQREAAVIALNFEKTKLKDALSQFVPDLVGKSVAIATKDLDSERLSFVQCIQQIKILQSPEEGSSSVPQLVQLNNSMLAAKKQQLESHDAVSVKLMAQFGENAVGNSLSNSWIEFQKSRGVQQLVGVRVQVPLGGVRERSRELAIATETLGVQAQNQQLSSQLGNEHVSALNLIKLLEQSQKALASSNKSLSTSLQSSRRKWNQARISVVEYLNEQDQLLANQSAELDVQLQIAHVVLDYFKTFDQFRCPVNQL